MAKRRLAYFNQALAAFKRSDYAEAFEGFLVIAEEGDPAAQYNLAGMYEWGLGTALDNERALHWYNRAAEQGYPMAQLTLGIKLRHGFGVPRDDVAALMWYRIAADSMRPGSEREELIRNLEFTKSRMSAFEIGEANRRAEAWWEEHGHRRWYEDEEEDNDEDDSG